jgi:hypothetical protein
LLPVGRRATTLRAGLDTVRGTVRPGPRRTAAMEELVAEARRKARERDWSPDEVGAKFWDGAAEDRIVALGMMERDPRLRLFGVALEAIEHPMSPFEQYHALQVASEMLERLDGDERDQLRSAVAALQEQRRFRADGARAPLAEQIRNGLNAGPVRTAVRR